MVCKKCSAEYDDAYVFCPECGEKNDDKFSSERTHTAISVQDVPDSASVGGGGNTEKFRPPEYNRQKKRAEKTGREVLPREKTAPVKKSASAVKKTDKKSDAATKIIAIILCAVGLINVFLAVIKSKTNALETQQQAQKAVAVSNLSAEDEAALESQLSGCYSALKEKFNRIDCDAESFAARINPADKGNFYSVINAVSENPQTQADPAGRFIRDDGTYLYYKLEETKVNNLLSRFGLSSDGAVNCKDYYYYDGFYYFNILGMQATPTVSADITKSKRVLDGSYYVECCFSVTDGSSMVKSDTYYLTVEKNENAATDGFPFVITRADTTAIFSATGSLKQDSVTDNYEMIEKVIEGTTNDGRVYCRYVLKYPVFAGKTIGENAINEFFAGTVSVHQLRADSAQKSYEEFISKGGKAEELPFTESVTVQVTYSDKDNISFVEKISTVSPEIPEKQEETTTQENYYGYGDYQDRADEVEPVKLPVKTYEAYIFDKNTGDFVVKDDCIGKNYVLISEILYRIYNGYDYQSIIPTETEEETTTEPETEFDPYEEEDYGYGFDYGDDYGYGEEETEDGVPKDEGELGFAIYESASCFTENGFSFYYVEDEGYATIVTIPWETVEIIKDLNLAEKG